MNIELPAEADYMFVHFTSLLVVKHEHHPFVLLFAFNECLLNLIQSYH